MLCYIPHGRWGSLNCVRGAHRAGGAHQYTALTVLGAPDLPSALPLDTEKQVPQCTKDSGGTLTPLTLTFHGSHPEKALLNPQTHIGSPG